MSRVPRSVSSSRAIPRLASRADITKSALWLGGYLLTGCIPSRSDRAAFDRLLGAKPVQWLFQRQLDLESIRQRVVTLLGGQVADLAVDAVVDEYFEMRLEDVWGRWRASHGPDWFVRTEVDGLEYLQESRRKGHGTVLWGMSFCGALFPKIALARSGVQVTQLSAAQHGTDYPVTLLGKYLGGPLYCRPENVYLRKRFVISAEADSDYKEQMTRTLRDNGCVWVRAEAVQTARPIAAELFGRRALFPPGAPALALRNDSTLIPVHTLRVAPFHYRVVLQPPISLAGGKTRAEGLGLIVQEFATRLADAVTTNPGTWSWELAWVTSLLNSPAASAGHPDEAT